MRRLACTGALVAVVLAGCSDEPAPSSSDPEPTETSSPSESDGSSPTETATPTPTESAESSPTRSASTAPETALLDWQQLEGSVDDQVTVSGQWQLTLSADGQSAELTGPSRRTLRAPSGFRVTDALIDGEYAVVVAEHEQASRPNVATVVELASGDVVRIDGRSEPATTVGGSWALGSGLLAHATSRGRDYCLSVVDLRSGEGRRGPCVPPRHGFNNVTITAAGISAMTFDDSRPSCRTLARVEGDTFEPIGGVKECAGWDAAVTETASVWSEIPNEKQIEMAEFFADTGSGPTALGPGTSGTLTWCGDAAYFVRDPQRDADPARLVRVRDGEAEVVYESPGRGRAFLSAPRCGGTDLTVTAFTAAGDEQVTASLR